MKHLFAVKSLDRLVGDTEDPAISCGGRWASCS